MAATPLDSNTTTTYTVEYDLTKPIIAISEHLTLREHRHSDAATLSKNASNIKIARNMSETWPHPYTVDKAHDWIARCRNESNWHATGPTDPKSGNTAGLGQKVPHAWVLALDDVSIGGMGYDFRAGVQGRTLNIGYWLAEEYWKKGIMTQALPMFVQWLWKTFPWIVKLEAWAYGWNPASSKLLERCGFQSEGRVRCGAQRFGALCDILIFGLVRNGIVSTEEPPTSAQP